MISLQANQKVRFDDDGEAVEESTSTKTSKEGRAYDQDDDNGAGGIDMAKAGAVLRAEDKFDREKERDRLREARREKKRKEKEAKNKRGKKGAAGDEEGGEEVGLR